MCSDTMRGQVRAILDGSGQTGSVGTGFVRPTRTGALLLGAFAFAWWVTSLRPFTDPPLVVVPLSGVAAMVLGARFLPARTPPAVTARQVVAWGALAVAAAAWQLAAFLQDPRREHPTLSSLANALFENHAVRAAAFLAWLAGAVALARR